MKKDLFIDILKSDGMTTADAEKHIKNGATIYSASDFLANAADYCGGLDPDDVKAICDAIRATISDGKNRSFFDNDIISYRGAVYYVEFCL